MNKVTPNNSLVKTEDIEAEGGQAIMGHKAEIDRRLKNLQVDKDDLVQLEDLKI